MVTPLFQRWNATNGDVAAAMAVIKCNIDREPKLASEVRYRVLNLDFRSATLLKTLVRDGDVDASKALGSCTEIVLNNICTFLYDDEIAARIIELLPPSCFDPNGRRAGSAAVAIAIKLDRPATLRALLAKGASPSATDNTGKSCVHLAVAKRSVATLRLLLEAGADPDAVDGDHETALHAAVGQVQRSTDSSNNNNNNNSGTAASAENIELEMARLLIAHGADPKIRNAYDCSPLYAAMMSGNVSLLSFLIKESKSSLLACAPDQSTLLHVCAKHCNSDLPFSVAELTDAGIDVNARNDRGDTPLHVACSADAPLTFVRQLLEAGADVNALNVMRRSPLHCVAKNRNASLSEQQLELLVAHGVAAVDGADSTGLTPLMLATRANNRAVVQRLLALGASVGLVSDDGTTALSDAALAAPAIVDALLDAGADPNQRIARGETALFSAAVSRSVEGLRALLRRGADVRVVAEFGCTALSKALYMMTDRTLCRDMALALLDAGADPNAHYSGWSSLMMMCGTRSAPLQAVFHALLQGGATNTADTRPRRSR